MIAISQELLFVAIPYASLALFVAGAVWRFRSPLDISARSSQLLERRWLSIGTIPFHAGLAILLIGHLLPLVAPAFWVHLVSNHQLLLVLESAGFAAGLLALSGAAILLVRRLSTATVRAITRPADVAVVVILIAQFAIGLAVAATARWGAVWSAVTVMPYLRSLFTLRPDLTLVTGLPLLVTIHMTAAWLILALVPFTRLVHIFSLPLGYLKRPPQKVVWTTKRPSPAPAATSANIAAADDHAVGTLIPHGR